MLSVLEFLTTCKHEAAYAWTAEFLHLLLDGAGEVIDWLSHGLEEQRITKRAQ